MAPLLGGRALKNCPVGNFNEEARLQGRFVVGGAGGGLFFKAPLLGGVGGGFLKSLNHGVSQSFAQIFTEL